MYIYSLLFQSEHNLNMVIDFEYPNCDNEKVLMYIQEN